MLILLALPLGRANELFCTKTGRAEACDLNHFGDARRRVHDMIRAPSSWDWNNVNGTTFTTTDLVRAIPHDKCIIGSLTGGRLCS